MITFYIDDSGTGSYKDRQSQPIFLFSGIAILDNTSFCNINTFMEQVILDLDGEVFKSLSKVVKISNRDHKNNVITTIKNGLYKNKKAEVHALHLVHGKEAYITLPKAKKHEILLKVFNYIKTNNVKVIIVKCEKKDVKNIEEINEKMSEGLIKAYNDFLEERKQDGVLIFDRGNDFIDKHFKEILKSRNDLYINPNLFQVDSIDTPLIQIADLTAYIANIYFNNSEKYKDYKQYYEMIKDNIILLDTNTITANNV